MSNTLKTLSIALKPAVCLLVYIFYGFNTVFVSADTNTIDNVQEDKIRAAVVIGIVRYTKWDANGQDQLKVCLVGDNPSFRHLENLHRSLAISDKTIDIVKIKENKAEISEKNCQVLVIGERIVFPVSEPLFNNSCLVICDECKNEEVSSVILRKERNRIRFEVDLHVAKQHGVRFSSAMLELAAKVEEVRDE